MRQSLWIKLLGIFILTILVSNSVIIFLVNRATTGQFEMYVTEAGQQWAAQMAPVLADYYARNSSWQGVEAILQNPLRYGVAAASGVSSQSNSQSNRQNGGSWNEGTWEMNGRDMMGEGSWEMDGRDMMNEERWEQQWWPNEQERMMNVWTTSGNRLVLTQPDGLVVADTNNQLVGSQLLPDDLARGMPVLVNGRPIGVLIVTPLDAPATPGGNFLSAVNRSVLWATAAAATVALVMGSMLFLQMTRPLHSLSTAAKGIATGDLSQRANPEGQDEVAQVARTFNQMADSLQEYETERRHMTAAIAHELRTPLSIIQSNLEAMLDGVLPTDADELVLLHQEARLLNRLIEDLRTLSLADAGQLQLHLEQVNVGEVAGQVAERLQLHAQEKGILLETVINPDLPLVQADPERLAQIFTNLIANALRYTPQGTRVELSVRTVNGSVETAVSDNGLGIPPDELPKLFDRFWRAEKSRSRATGGSGLGLAVVKQLVEAHNGRIIVESTRGLGTRFTFILPIA
jgi:two-component system OmpR family sensor kinase/two-component system sensor histidine kinase BaeS